MHTPEPWIVETGCTSYIYDELGVEIAKVDDPRDAERIVACVNACTGINPASVPKMKKVIEMVMGMSPISVALTDVELREIIDNPPQSNPRAAGAAEVLLAAREALAVANSSL